MDYVNNGAMAAMAAALAANSQLSSDKTEMRRYLDRLKAMVPQCPKNRQVSRQELIEHVIDYISDLQDTLQSDSEDDSRPGSPMDDGDFSHAFTQQPQYSSFGQQPQYSNYGQQPQYGGYGVQPQQLPQQQNYSDYKTNSFHQQATSSYLPCEASLGSSYSDAAFNNYKGGFTSDNNYDAAYGENHNNGYMYGGLSSNTYSSNPYSMS